MTALTAICENCGKPYGEHAQFGSWCLVGDRFSTTQKFDEDLFTSSGDGFTGGRSAYASATADKSVEYSPDSSHGLCRDVSCNRLECQRDLREHQQEILKQELSSSGSGLTAENGIAQHVRKDFPPVDGGSLPDSLPAQVAMYVIRKPVVLTAEVEASSEADALAIFNALPHSKLCTISAEEAFVGEVYGQQVRKRLHRSSETRARLGRTSS